MASLKKFINELDKERSSKPELISFNAIRKAVGWLGILLPLALLTGSFLFSDCCKLQPSISHYYYTNMREVFVGVLCAVSLFLFTYKGHNAWDSISANLAGLFALGVAIFPTDIADYACQQSVQAVFTISANNTLHYISAAMLFLTLACISLFLFTKSNKPKSEWGLQKRRRNRVYLLCGIAMMACIATIFVYKVLLKYNGHTTLTYWMETFALIAFGISWLTKGEALLGDKQGKELKK